MKLGEILRASHITRWSIVNVIKPQSMAEHSFNVCMIARALCSELGISDAQVTKAALEHDLDEVLWGDPPTPVKVKMKELGFDYNKHLSNEMRHLSEIEKHIIKIADMMDAALFLWDHGIGNHAKRVRLKLENRISAYINNHMEGSSYLIVDKFIKELYHERKDI